MSQVEVTDVDRELLDSAHGGLWFGTVQFVPRDTALQAIARVRAEGAAKLESMRSSRNHLLGVLDAVNAITKKGNREGTPQSVERAIAEQNANAAELRDALELFIAATNERIEGDELTERQEKLLHAHLEARATLETTPAASLAAHDANVLNVALSDLPAGYYLFRKKFDDADSYFDAAVLTPEAIDALGDLGVSECAYTMAFADCVKALEHEVKP